MAIFLILLNGFFVAAEFALVKIRMSQIEARVQQGSDAAKVARECVRELDPYLSATQLGITLASLGLGWIGHGLFGHVLGPVFDLLDITDPLTRKSIAGTVGYVIISFLHIVIGEVAPKSLAIARPVGTSLFVARPLRLFYRLFYPALIILNASSSLILRMLKVEPVVGHSMAVTPEELRQIAAESAAGGTISRGQGDLLQNVFTFSDRVAREIMVPRNQVVAIDIDQSSTEVLDRLLNPDRPDGASLHRHTRYPMYRGDLGNIVGVLHLKDLIKGMRRGARPPLDALVREAHFVPDTMSAQRLLREFQRLRSHLVIVVDEHGNVAGIVTIEDTLEELVGEIQDEFDAEEPPIRDLADGRYELDGGVLVDELTALLGLPRVDCEADTVSGYIMEQLGRIPVAGDAVVLADWRLEAALMERHRVSRVLVSPCQEPDAPADAPPDEPARS